jgi:hypothetical protein
MDIAAPRTVFTGTAAKGVSVLALLRLEVELVSRGRGVRFMRWGCCVLNWAGVLPEYELGEWCAAGVLAAKVLRLSAWGELDQVGFELLCDSVSLPLACRYAKRDAFLPSRLAADARRYGFGSQRDPEGPWFVCFEAAEMEQRLHEVNRRGRAG